MITTLQNLNLDTYNTIILDCYGTLLEIKEKTNPYKFLYEHINSIRKIDNFNYDAMTKNMDIKEIQEYYDIDINQFISEQFLIMLKKELDSITIYDDVLEFLNNNKNKNIILCSNIAHYYVAQTKILLPINNYVMSCEVGYKKPDFNIYQICEHIFHTHKDKTIFIGDSRKNDYLKPIEYGFNAELIKRD